MKPAGEQELKPDLNKFSPFQGLNEPVIKNIFKFWLLHVSSHFCFLLCLLFGYFLFPFNQWLSNTAPSWGEKGTAVVSKYSASDSYSTDYFI